MYDFAKKHGVPKEVVDSMIDKHPMLHAYKECIADGLAEQDAAYFLPQGVETSLVVTGNFRAWYEYLPKRLCKRAMPSIESWLWLFKNAWLMQHLKSLIKTL